MTGARGPTALVFDPITDVEWSYEVEVSLLAERGIRLCVPRGPEEAWSSLGDADVLIVCRTLPSEAINSLKHCIGILCYKVGTDGVDVELARGAGIEVQNVPDYCTSEVSDHALMLLLAAARRLLPLSTAAAAGNWDVYGGPAVRSIRRLSSLNLGIVGAGRIGAQVARKAQAFGMRTLAFDPFLKTSPVPGLELVGLDQLMTESDAVVLCAALHPGSRFLIDKTALSKMRNGSILINVGRGALIDEVALAAAVKEGRIAVAALDVRSHEPPESDDPFRSLNNVILTPHIAAVSQESLSDLHRMAAEAVIHLLERAGRVSPPAVP